MIKLTHDAIRKAVDFIRNIKTIHIFKQNWQKDLKLFLTV